ncbi:CHAT domain-containing protein [Silvibacterium bohemicum]|uniref:CHAT domain-containing protein n=1 Tax=Silvibacterium bohemicum TaxID=1577686 RepID=A0A841K2A6_9BACT|nr:CHAT domain-containing protein [Silvibacterium bohemicum]MBB6147135.1 CHAT domain-containing protein [Silvibacterium bohemicum]
MNPPRRVPSEKIEELLDRLVVREDGEGIGSHSILEISRRRGSCPAPSEWQRIASNGPADEQSRRLVEHAAECQHCGAQLSFWAGVLSDEQTPEETAMLGQLSSLTPAWQERMAQTMLAATRQSKSPSGMRVLWPWFLGAGGLAAAAALFVLFLGGMHPQSSPERLLAEAYTDHRVMDARIPLAGFAPVDSSRHSRAAGPTMSDSVPLLEARAAITQALMKTPEDPHWLLLQARSDLLNESYDPAIDTLKRLLAADPGNVSALTDLASAYLMRSRASEAATDEATALDYLEQAARREPNNSIVIYNEALVLQDLFQYSNAIAAWKRFLAVEHDPAWVADGKKRLAEIEALEAKVKAQQSRLDPFLGNPEGMLHLARSPAMIADYDEELSTVSLPHLLQAAFPPPAVDSSFSNSSPPESKCTETCSAARTLLRAVAASLREHHRDQWLEDLLAGAATPGYVAGVRLLARALDDGRYANPANALKEAQEAQAAFQHTGNIAGIAAARVQQVYDLEHLLDPRVCLLVAHDLQSSVSSGRYPWQESLFWSDQSSCYARQNDFADAMASLHRALTISSDAGYRVIHLRALGFAASDEEAMGNRGRAWKMNMQVLRDYWSGNYPMIRRLQPYVSLAYTEQRSSRFYSAELLRREAVSVAALQGNPEQLNSNRFLLVKAEIQAGDTLAARRDLEIAKSELVSLPDHVALRGAAANTGILLAEAYLVRGDAQAAARMLETVASDVDAIGNREMELSYTATAGRLALQQGNYQLAADRLTRGLADAEAAYGEVKDQQDRIDWIESSRGIYAALVLLWQRQGKDPLESLALWERYRILSSGVSLQNWCHGADLACLAQPLEAARRHLKQETIVGTIRLDHSLLLWTMDGQGVRMHEVGIEPERFDLLCHAFSEVLATPASSEAQIRFYGARLAASLLTPVASSLEAHRTLVFDLDDSMEFLPVAALPVNGRYLGLQFGTSTIHSVLLASREPEMAKLPRPGVVVGASDPGDPEASRLPEAKSEALAVAGFLHRPKVFVGDEAAAGAVAAAAPHAALIHFAGHTRYVNGVTQLLMASSAGSGPDWLDARTFGPHAFADCRLVVLSACSTGKKEERESDDIQDIVQTFTTEGAQQVVATHWDVDSAASVALMKEFYSGLARGLAVPQALLQAENSVSTITEYRHPYYWAPYYVFGMSTTNLKELLHND